MIKGGKPQIVGRHFMLNSEALINLFHLALYVNSPFCSFIGHLELIFIPSYLKFHVQLSLLALILSMNDYNL